MFTMLALLTLTPHFQSPLRALVTPEFGPDSGRTLNGVTLPEAIEVAGHRLVLNGMALRKKLVFKVYVAGLYLVQPDSTADAILAADEPRRIVLHFLRSVDKEKMCGAWNESLTNNTPGASRELEAKFKTLCEYMEDIDKGQQFIFTYLPDSGTAVEVKGTIKGTIEGKEFADALFKSWIGPRPGPGEDFKQKLLGRS
jgi:hypothetical protein